jgi:hypothetical protein
MDWYTADGKPPKQLDHKKVNDCDAFAVIVGHLYGSCPPGEQKSFTELEYEAAMASAKPVPLPTDSPCRDRGRHPPRYGQVPWRKAEDRNKELIGQAKSLTREALESADRCAYRLKQADIHNFLAEMALAEGDKATALKHVEIAKERAWCDAPPYCYRKALDQAEQMLAKLR